MNKKQFFKGLCMAGILTLNSVSVAAVYEEPIRFTAPVYKSGDGVTVIEGPQAGGFYVSAEATYSGTQSRTARLLCAFYDAESGVLRQVTASNEAGWPGTATQTLTARVDINSMENGSFRCFYVDDLQRHTPLQNEAPAAPGGFTAQNATAGSVELSWNEAEDDFQQVAGYTVYKNGMQVTETSNTSFVLSNLMRNQSALVEVRASDGHKLSNSAAVTVVPQKISSLCFDVNQKDSNHRVQSADSNLVFMAIPYGAAGVTESNIMAGKLCSHIENGKYPGFTVNTDYIKPTDREIVFEFTYLDVPGEGKNATYIYAHDVEVGTTSWGISTIINPDNPSETISIASKPIEIRNSGVWKTSTITFTNAEWTENGAGSGQFYQNFRIYSANTGDFYIACGNVYKKEDYQPMNPNMTVDGGMVVYGMNFTVPGGYDTAYRIDEKEGKPCAVGATAAGLCYSVTDVAVLGAPSALLEVEFYDDRAGDTLQVSGTNIQMDGSGWRYAAIPMAGTQLSNLDFTRASGEAVCLGSLQAYAK